MKAHYFLILLGIVAMASSYIYSERTPEQPEPACTHWGTKTTVIPGVTVAHCDKWSLN